MLVPPLAQRAHGCRTATRRSSWPELVERVRTGPPPWSPTRLEPVDTVVNLAEMFLHHEDVLRAAPGWEPRPLPDDLEQGLWSDADAHRPAPVPPLAGGRGAGDAHARPAAGAQRARRVRARSSCAAPPVSCCCTPRAGSRVARVLVEGPGRGPGRLPGTDLRL